MLLSLESFCRHRHKRPSCHNGLVIFSILNFHLFQLRKAFDESNLKSPTPGQLSWYDICALIVVVYGNAPARLLQRRQKKATATRASYLIEGSHWFDPSHTNTIGIPWREEYAGHFWYKWGLRPIKSVYHADLPTHTLTDQSWYDYHRVPFSCRHA